MKEGNIILQKSYAFAVRIVRLSQYLVKEKHAFQLTDQIRRSGTSVGANMEEAVGGLSRKDFVAKCGISCKEARETHYWLRLLRDTDYIDSEQAASLHKRLRGVIKNYYCHYSLIKDRSTQLIITNY